MQGRHRAVRLLFVALCALVMSPLAVHTMDVNPNFALRVSVRNTKWQKHVEWVLGESEACKQADPLNDLSPCNRFVGQALERIWGIKDFKTLNNSYLLADEIAAYMPTHSPPWQLLGVASDQATLTKAQDEANKSRAVVAIRPSVPAGHIAMILPGQLSRSPNWNLDVPNSASFFLGHPELTYVGKRLSNAFGADKKNEVKIYSRIW